ncbi:MAG: hypothetical protein M3R67_14390, partial [Acidobacteriota bacterium]|nr:hypothetical protein [Acidobacteriota bacterium]
LNEGARDQSGKIVGLPIDQAMQKVVGNLPSRIQGLSEQAATEHNGSDIPTAASSGRMTEKIKQ